MTEPVDPKTAAPPRQPTVQSGRGSLFGSRDDRWDGAPSRIVEGRTPRWIDRAAKSPDRIGPPAAPPSPPPPDLAPVVPVQPAPESFLQARLTDEAPAQPSRLGQLAIPLAILAFALATESIVLPAIFLVLWLQRRKIAPSFRPPWEDPATVKDWLDRYAPKPGASASPLQAFLLGWLDRPPYQDPPALRDWVRIRIGSTVIALFGAIFVVRVLMRLLSPATGGGGGDVI